MSYYNTVPEKGKTLKAYQEKARTQDQIIKGIINNYKGSFSFKDIYMSYPVQNTPITSIRRSLDTLKKEGYIKETGEMVTGIFSRKERELIKS